MDFDFGRLHLAYDMQDVILLNAIRYLLLRPAQKMDVDLRR